MKKITFGLTLLLIMTLSLSPTFSAIYFSDVPSKAWYQSDLNDVTQDSRKIVVGFPDGTFKPNGSFTVAQLATCVVKASYYKDLKNTNSKDAWYKVFIDKSKELKYIQDGEFVEKDYVRAITRGEMARIVARAVENINGPQTYRDETKIKSLIKDYDQIPLDLRESIIKVYDLKIIGGFPDGTFKANEPFNRAQAVTVMNKLINPEKRINSTVDALFQTTPPPIIGTGNFYKVNPEMPQELYQYAYTIGEFDNFVGSNKWLVEKWGIINVTEWMNLGKGYVETFYDVDYQTYNKEQHIKDIKWYFSPQITWIADDGIERPIEEHISYWADMIKEKQIKITSEFLSDPSLVYSNGITVVRGKLTYTVESCNDMQWLKKYTKLGNVQIGKQYTCIYEVDLANLEILEGWIHASKVCYGERFLTPITEVK